MSRAARNHYAPLSPRHVRVSFACAGSDPTRGVAVGPCRLRGPALHGNCRGRRSRLRHYTGSAGVLWSRGPCPGRCRDPRRCRDVLGRTTGEYPRPVAARSDGSISGVAHEWTSPQGRREGLRPNTTGDPWPGSYASDRTRPVVSDHRDRRRIEQRPVAVDAVAQGARDVLVRDAQSDRADLV
jgi:hypothetical protein